MLCSTKHRVAAKDVDVELGTSDAIMPCERGAECFGLQGGRNVFGHFLVP